VRGVRSQGGTNTGAPVEAEASRRAALRRRSPPRCTTTLAELAGMLAEDLTGRATDVAQWSQRLLDEEQPWSGSSARSSGRGAEHATAATRSRGTRHRARLAPLRGDTNVTPEPASAAEDAYIARIRALHEAFTPTATIQTIGDLVKLAPRLAPARTMATLFRRYRDLDARAVALEGAMEETVNGWQEYNERQAEIAIGK
jgi:hypothetical protein